MFEKLHLRKYSKELHKLYNQRRSLQKIIDDMNFDELQTDEKNVNQEIDTLSDLIDSYIENEYSRAVFDEYSKKKPDLIRIKTGEIIKWDVAFGYEFENVTKSLRHSLVGLVELPGRYKLKDDR